MPKAILGGDAVRAGLEKMLGMPENVVPVEEDLSARGVVEKLWPGIEAMERRNYSLGFIVRYIVTELGATVSEDTVRSEIRRRKRSLSEAGVPSLSSAGVPGKKASGSAKKSLGVAKRGRPAKKVVVGRVKPVDKGLGEVLVVGGSGDGFVSGVEFDVSVETGVVSRDEGVGVDAGRSGVDAVVVVPVVLPGVVPGVVPEVVVVPGVRVSGVRAGHAFDEGDL